MKNVEKPINVIEAAEKFCLGKSVNTRKTYLSLANSLEKFLIQNGLTLENVSPLKFKEWIFSFETANSMASAKRFLSALLRFLGYDVGFLKTLLREVKPDFSKFRVDLTSMEIMKLIEACYETSYKFAVSLMAFNGLRVSEVLGLYWEDVNTEKNTLTLQRRQGEKYYPKGMSLHDRPISIPLNPISKQLYLQLYRETENHQGRILPFSYKTFLKWFYRYTKGVLDKPYKITPHKLRHAFAHIWLQNRGSLLRLKSMLRHKRLETTTIYSEPSERELRIEFRRVFKKIS
ncbi:MAG: site-specific integrase [Candidatus Bathyarchaeia archaeon]